MNGLSPNGFKEQHSPMCIAEESLPGHSVNGPGEKGTNGPDQSRDSDSRKGEKMMKCSRVMTTGKIGRKERTIHLSSITESWEQIEKREGSGVN